MTMKVSAETVAPRWLLDLDPRRAPIDPKPRREPETETSTPGEHAPTTENAARVEAEAEAEAETPFPHEIHRARALLKRATDLVGSLLGLVLLAPLFAVVAALIVLSDGFPVFYVQERVGRRGRIFRIWKFRSMRRDAEQRTGPVWAADRDERCTTVGAWLRRANIDELPQLWNVLKGDMSLVGPRPERPVFVERFRNTLPGYDQRHRVPVGMTGWAQVHGYRGRTSIRKRLQYDLDYARRWTPGLDLAILVMTVQHVLQGKTRWTSSPVGLRPARPRRGTLENPARTRRWRVDDREHGNPKPRTANPELASQPPVEPSARS